MARVIKNPSPEMRMFMGFFASQGVKFVDAGTGENIVLEEKDAE